MSAVDTRTAAWLSAAEARIVAARPDRVVFGTNWPHPNHFPPEINPDDGDLIDLFCEWFPDAAVRQRIFTDNPAQLYGFPAKP